MVCYKNEEHRIQDGLCNAGRPLFSDGPVDGAQVTCARRTSGFANIVPYAVLGGYRKNCEKVREIAIIRRK